MATDTARPYCVDSPNAQFTSPSATAFAPLTNATPTVETRRVGQRTRHLLAPRSDAAPVDLRASDTELCNTTETLDFTGVQYAESEPPSEKAPPTPVQTLASFNSPDHFRPPVYSPSIHYRSSLVAGRPLNFWQRTVVARYHKYPAEIHWLAFYTVVLATAFGIQAVFVAADPVVGSALCVAKGSSQVILVNAWFLLLSMCRTVVAYLRQFGSTTSRVPVDKHIGFFKICGFVMLVASLVHAITWGIIIDRIQTAPEALWQKSRLVTSLAFLRTETQWGLLRHVPMWTGNAMLLITFVAACLLHPKLRGTRVDSFWLAHVLCLPVLLLVLVHGLAMWVETPQAFLWVLPPLALYFVEMRNRLGKLFGGHTSIMRVDFLHDTVAIFMKKPADFHFHPGMYLFLNVPEISRFEWHPFTISSAPEDECLSVHVRNTSGWTGALYRLLKTMDGQRRKRTTVNLEANRLEAELTPFPSVCIDGPVGTPSQDYFQYQSVVFIGAGADGITPFASILRSIMHQWESFKCPCCEVVAFPRKFQIQKIYCYWITREHESIMWFNELMEQLTALDTEGRLEIHHSFTHASTSKRVQTFLSVGESQQSEASGSSAKNKQLLHAGCPNWNHELQRIANEDQDRLDQRRREREALGAQRKTHLPLQPPFERFNVDALSQTDDDVAVFYSGPRAMARTIHDACAHLNLQQRAYDARVMFDFRRESFY